jgi:collagen type VII alpha
MYNVCLLPKIVNNSSNEILVLNTSTGEVGRKTAANGTSGSSSGSSGSSGVNGVAGSSGSIGTSGSSSTAGTSGSSGASGSTVLFAVVPLAGTTFTRQSGATSVSRPANGNYLITFNQDVSGGAFIANVQSATAQTTAATVRYGNAEATLVSGKRQSS